MAALTFWRMWPRQIASDLSRFHYRRIADWHSGAMSSLELLDLFGVSIVDDADTKTRTVHVEFAPEDGALAEALRGGDRPEWKQMLAQSANELAVLRVVQAPGAQADEYGSRLFLPVDRQRELADQNAELQRLRDEIPGQSEGLAALWHVREEVS